MATEVADLSAILKVDFGSELFDQNNRSFEFLRHVPINTQVGGEKLRRPWVVSGSTVAVSSEGAQITSFDTDVRENWEQAWGLYTGAIQVTDLAMDVSVGGYNPGNALFQQEIQTKVAELCKKIDLDMLTGASTGIIGALSGAIHNAGSYGGVSRLNHEQAKSYITGSATGIGLTTAMMRQAVDNVTLNCGVRPNLIVSHFSPVRKYADLLDPFTVSNQPETLAAGFVNVGAPMRLFEGIRVLPDQNCTARSMYFVNTDKIELVQLAPNLARGSILGIINVPVGRGTLTFVLRELYTNYTSKQFVLQWNGQMHCQSRFHGAIHDINIAP